MTAGRKFLTCEWRRLLMVNFEIDPEVLRPHVPAGTELDLWQGRAVASIVGFQFRHTRVMGLAVPGHRHFEELNLRFYVRRPHPEGPRSGVVFIKEIVARRAVALLARHFYNENFVVLPLRHRRLPSGALEYGWRKGDRFSGVRATPCGTARLPAAGSEEEFITEHYWGYSAQPDGDTIEYRVDHPQWRVQEVRDVEYHCDVARVYGEPFVSALSRAPRSAFLAEGSPIVLYRGARMGDDCRQRPLRRSVHRAKLGTPQRAFPTESRSPANPNPDSGSS